MARKNINQVTEYQAPLPSYTTEYTENWQALARAIVIDVAKDYQSKYAAYWSRTHCIDANGNIRELEADKNKALNAEVFRTRRWFAGHWCEGLVYFGTDGGEITGLSIAESIERFVDKKLSAKMIRKWKKEVLHEDVPEEKDEEEVSDRILDFIREEDECIYDDYCDVMPTQVNLLKRGNALRA